jgi:hypothetical protein
MALALIKTNKKLTREQIKQIKEIIPDAVFPKHLYSYHLKSESCDDYYGTDTRKLDAIQFMKEYATGEYEGWMSDEGMKESEIPYCDFNCEEIL